ncbi:MAG TPA: gamma carbonic anhydrase family protein [Acidimicrobiales bacterium]|jgi:carbonic anhydrase/acetyltransferase-like protein (isoleucine patch superfamily)|nr:gamma carbonic anhydrase family protein [Acidimicrobiales bacterium]
MGIYAIGDRVPEIDESAFVHPDATVIGHVVLGPNSSVWPQAVIRGDYGTVTVGADSNVQDGAVLHATSDLHTVVGAQVVIGHLAHLEGCTIEDRALIGVGSAVLHRAVVSAGATVGAGAVVTNGMVVPARALAVGVPATIKADRSDPDLIAAMAELYVHNAGRYRTSLRRLD